jgi:hypothetical protein
MVDSHPLASGHQTHHRHSVPRPALLLTLSIHSSPSISLSLTKPHVVWSGGFLLGVVIVAG